jgi:hypothetical protein
MYTDLWGDEHLESNDYADEIIQKLNQATEIAFSPNYDTAAGVILNPSESYLVENGFHCIYRNGVPMYVGYAGANNSTRARLGRFLSVARGVNRDDEGHGGAERYLKMFENQNVDLFAGLTVRAVEYFAGQDIMVRMDDIAEDIAVKINAVLNNKVYSYGKS